MEKKLRDATARVLEETKRASELDVQLSDTQHKVNLYIPATNFKIIV